MTQEQINSNNRFIHNLAFKELDELAEKRWDKVAVELELSDKVRCCRCGKRIDRQISTSAEYSVRRRSKNNTIILKKYRCPKCQHLYRPYKENE